MKASEEQARALGLQPQRLRLAGPTPDLEAAFAAIKQEHADAVLVLEEPLLGGLRDEDRGARGQGSPPHHVSAI